MAEIRTKHRNGRTEDYHYTNLLCFTCYRYTESIYVFICRLGRQRCRWVDNIKIDLREIRWDGIDWIDLTQDRDQWRALVNTVMNFRCP
jgi:hypothetical protein